MQPTTTSLQAELTHRLQASLQQAQTYTVHLRTNYTRLLVGGLVSSAATTLVAGGTALGGPTAGIGDAGWRLACVIAAVLSLASTICVGIGQQLKLGERLPQAQLCVGQLRALDVQLGLGSRDWTDIAKEYEEIIKTNADVFD